MFEFLRRLFASAFQSQPLIDPISAIAAEMPTPPLARPEPVQEDPTANVTILYHLARSLSEFVAIDRFAIRGSLALHAWFGPLARNPRDVDVVCVDELGEVLPRLASRPSRVAGGELTWGQNHIVPIGDAYDQPAKGHRLLVPFVVNGETVAQPRLDWVSESLEPEATRPVTIQLPDTGETLELVAVVPELELLWKLLWLTGEYDRQAKDLFDAALIVDQLELQSDLMAKLFLARVDDSPRLARWRDTLWQLAAREDFDLPDIWPAGFPTHYPATNTPHAAWETLVRKLPPLLKGVAFLPTVEEIPLWEAARKATGARPRTARLIYADWLEDHARPEGEFLRHHERITSSSTDWGVNELRRWFALYPELPAGFAASLNVPLPRDFKRIVEQGIRSNDWREKAETIREVLRLARD